MTATRLQILAFKARYAEEWAEYLDLTIRGVEDRRRNEVFSFLVNARKELGLRFYVSDEVLDDARKL